MVSKKEIRLSDLRQFFITRKELHDFITKHNIELKYKQKDEVLQNIIEKKIEENIRRQNQLRSYNVLVPKDHTVISKMKPGALGKLFKDKIYLVYWHKNDMFTQKFKEILTSDDLNFIAKHFKKNYYFAKTKQEADRIKEKLNEKVNKFIDDDDVIIKDTNAINFTTELIKSDNDFGLKYRIGGLNVELTYKFWNDYCVEATVPKKWGVYKRSGEITCVVKCILHLNGRYFKKRKADKLIKSSEELVDKNNELSLTDIEVLAKEFQINIYVLDVEGDMMLPLEYRKCDPMVNTDTYIMIYKRHARIIRKEWRRILAASEEKNMRLQNKTNIIRPLSEGYENRPDILYDYDINAIELLQEDTVIFIDDMVYIYNFLSENNYDFSFCGWAKTILSLKITNRNNRSVEFRNSGINHALLEYAPFKYNLTFGSSTMYLFRCFMKNSLIKPSDPVISKIFKSMCSPMINMKACSIKNEHVYIWDLSRAYRNSCKNLGTFKNVPRLKLLNKNINLHNFKKLKKGIFEVLSFNKKNTKNTTDTNKTSTWHINEMVEYLFEKKREKSKSKTDCNIKIFIRYYIYFEEETNVIDDFANYIDEELELDDIHKKQMINILVGKLHPKDDDNRERAIYDDKTYFDQMMMKNNKDIYFYNKLPDGKYYIEFNFKNNSKQLTGYNASYLPAQIIQRCKLKVLRCKDYLIKQGCEIIGSMTDSVIFTSKKKINIRDPLWKVEAYGDSITSKGIGRYEIRKKDQIITSKHQGSTSFHTTKETPSTQMRKNKNDIQINILPASYLIVEGKAGYGKSYYIKQTYKNDNYLRVSYTALAADEINGSTINSLFKLGIGDRDIYESLFHISFQTKLKLQTISTLIIDEYYTLPDDIFQKMNSIIRFIRCDNRLLGGLDLVLVGDSKQTSAIGKGFVDSNEFEFIKKNAKMKELKWHSKCRLTKRFDNFVNFFRSKRNHSLILEKLKSDKFSKKPLKGPNTYYVYYTNKRVARRNLISLKSQVVTGGDIEIIKKMLLSGKSLKKDTPLMILKNTKHINNGSIVFFEKMENDTMFVKVPEKNRLYTLKIADTEFRLAYAMTIHKAQCKTFNGINIILTKKELHQENICRLLYTAITRVRDFSNCYIRII